MMPPFLLLLLMLSTHVAGFPTTHHIHTHQVQLDCANDIRPKVTAVLNTFFYPELVQRGLMDFLRHRVLHVQLIGDAPSRYSSNATHVHVAAEPPPTHLQQPHDLLRVLGRLLQDLAMTARQGTATTLLPEVMLPAAQAGPYSTRSHQLGYYFNGRNEELSAYVRELAVFGANQVEFAHWKWESNTSSSELQSLNTYCYGGNISAQVEWSGIIDEMGLNMSVWWPVDVFDYDNGKSMENLVSKLKRLDSLFVPGGDGGIVLSPKEFFPAVEKMATLVRKYHPHASVWMSAQEYDKANLTEFMTLAADSSVSSFLTGVAYGPHVVVPLVEFDQMVPKGMPVRQYPDICHAESAQYELYQWDPRLAATHGRTVVNPMPEFFYNIATMRMNASYTTDQAGFGAYSEGISDDFNKAIWSSVYSDPTRSMQDIVKSYAAYYTSNGKQSPESAANSAMLLEQLIFALEKTFNGALEDNTVNVMNALSLSTALQQSGIMVIGNWRLQAFIYRAFFDAYVLHRVQHENNLLNEVHQLLAVKGSESQSQVKALLATSLSGLDAAAHALKNQTLEMASALGNTLGSSAILQCQVPDLGISLIDNRISDVQWLQWLSNKSLLQKADVVAAVLNYTNAGPGGHFDVGGSVRGDDHPHLDPGQGALSDPSSFFTPIQAVHPPKHDDENRMPFSWFQYSEVYYDDTLKFVYPGLEKNANYALTVVFHPGPSICIVANGNLTLKDYFVPGQMPLTVSIPAIATSTGRLELGFHQPPGLGGSGRAGMIADIWVHLQETVLGVSVLARHIEAVAA